MSITPDDEALQLLHRAISLVREAIETCDAAGADLPACHLQLGLDLLHRIVQAPRPPETLQ